MTFDKFTIKAQEAVQEAIQTAQRNGQQAIEPEHLLKGILVKDKDISNYLFQKMGANPSQIERIVDSEITHLPKVQGGILILAAPRTRCCNARSTTPRRWATNL